MFDLYVLDYLFMFYVIDFFLLYLLVGGAGVGFGGGTCTFTQCLPQDVEVTNLQHA